MDRRGGWRQVVPENHYKVEKFKGLVIARRNRGMGSSFSMLNHVAGQMVVRMWPLYSPHVLEMKILERRKVRQNKLYYMKRRPPAEYTFR
jgi:large subunit ribosomal protein L19